MATIYSFGPFQLDDESEILFRGKKSPRQLVNAPLRPANKALLQAGSVIGRRFSPRLLAAITEVAVDDSLPATTALDLVRCGASSESYAFRHVLVCDALYAGAQRTALHMKIARASCCAWAVRKRPQKAVPRVTLSCETALCLLDDVDCRRKLNAGPGLMCHHRIPRRVWTTIRLSGAIATCLSLGA